MDERGGIMGAVKLYSREYQKENTVIDVGGIKIGQDVPTIIAGPCAVESAQQILKIAQYVKEIEPNALLRGGIFKPRTSPYSFQGLGEEGLTYLLAAKTKYQLPIVCELTSIEQVRKYAKDIDIIQIGSRNMQNYELLKAVGQLDQPIILKRGYQATIDEFLHAAEYILLAGNKKVILCERGIRSFETAYRNVTDINAIAYLKTVSHLPILIDPSHATGQRQLVNDIAAAGIVAGASGILVETHYNPDEAKSDKQQTIDKPTLGKLVHNIKILTKAMTHFEK